MKSKKQSINLKQIKMNNQKLKIHLWFDDQAEEAVKFYTSVFETSQIHQTTYYNKEGQDIHGQPEGRVMTIDFTLNEMHFVALNGGPEFKFNEAISILVECDKQEEVDHYWEKLSKDGEEGPCGWLKDRYGISWQITAKALTKLLTESPKKKSERVMAAFMKMKKLDIQTLIEA